MRGTWVAALVLTAGCASAPIKPNDALALAAADARVREGCYDCLLGARNTYARIGVGRARPLVIARLFETELLIAVREKALALDPAETIARARALGPELPGEYPTARLLAIVEAVLPDTVGTPIAEFERLRRERRAFEAQVDAEVTWLPTSPLTPAVKASLALSLDCSFATRARPGEPRRRTAERPALPPDAVPLVTFDAATCGAPSRPLLERVRTAVPGFVETAYFLGRLGLFAAKNDGGPRVRDELAEVYARFSMSPAVTYLAGNYNQLIGDCREALRYYDETITLRPLHENGWLGRTMCLSYLKRHDEAIQAATRLIDLGPQHRSDAYYWRSWNYHTLKDLSQARRDIERAKAIAVTGEIFTLAGMIEHDQDDLATAERDLNAARAVAYGSRNCVAAWYLGLVSMKQQRWTPSSVWFETAMACYDANVQESEAGLAAMRARTDVDPAFQARQIAGFEAAVKEDRSQYYAAAFNAANQGARGGNVARARELIEVAARDPALADLVRQLREILK